MKTILTVWHSAGKGKSSTIREFAHTLISTFPGNQIIYSDTVPFNPTGDFRLIIKINGEKIAVESKGDPSSDLKGRLDEIYKDYNPGIIICASRTRGLTVSQIDAFAAKNSYQQIWTSTYHMDTHHNQVNKLKAKHMIELLQNLNLI
jgi:hypothetical protein